MEPEVLDRTYRAFISYRHADNKHAGRQWATWLHQAIETYEVPQDLVGTKNQRGEAVPSRIFPIFRDEEELPAHADLGNAITLALDNTETLIVLCSPNAVQSTYVADEISYFKQLGRSDRIIAALIGGEPNCSWDTSKVSLGFEPEDECFPVPLQFEFDKNGQTNKRAEPIAADFRVNEEGRPYQGWTSPEAYRSWLVQRDQDSQVIAAKVESYTGQLHLMRLKIIAGILGIPLGHLTKRDQAYQLAQEKEKAKKLRRWLTAVGTLAVVAISSGIWAWTQRQAALESERIAVERLKDRQIADANRLTNEAIEYLDNGNTNAALARLSEAIPEDISAPEWPISAKTESVLNRAVASLKGNTTITTDITTFAHLEVIDEQHLLAISDGNHALLFSKQGNLIHEWHFDDQMNIHVTKDKQRLVGAAIVKREEPAPEDHFMDTHYVDYFVTRTVELNTGKTLSEVDIKLDDQSIWYHNVNSSISDNRLFSPDGSRYLAYAEDNSTGKTQYSLLVMDTDSGETAYQAPLVYYPRNLFAIDNDRFVALQTRYESDDSSYLEQLLFISKQGNVSQTLLQLDSVVACNNGSLEPVLYDDRDHLTVGISDSQNKVVAMWKQSYSDSNFCIRHWDFSNFEPSPIVAFDYVNDEALSATQNLVVKSAQTTAPILIYRDESGELEAAKRFTVDSVLNSQLSLYADEFQIIIGNQAYPLPHDAGQIEEVAFDDDLGQLWYASVDRTIRNYSYRGSETRIPMALSSFHNEVYKQDNITIVVNKKTVLNDYGDWQSTFWKSDAQNDFITQSFSITSNDEYPNIYVYPNKLIGMASVAPEAEELDTWDKKEIDVELFYASNGESAVRFNLIDRFKELPAHNYTHLAYVHNKQLHVFDFSSLQQSTFTFPELQTPFDVLMLKDKIVVATSDEHTDDPDKRVISLFNVSADFSQVEKLTEMQAQSLTIEPMNHGQSALLKWDLFPYGRPNRFQAIYNDLSVKDIEIAWEDDFGVQFLLPKESEQIFVVTDYKYAKQYDFAGNEMAETLTRTKWFGGFLSADAKYLVTDDAILPLSETGACELPSVDSDSSPIKVSPNATFLAFANGNSTYVFDLRSCTTTYEVPLDVRFADNLFMSDDGTLYLLTSQGAQVHTTIRSLEHSVGFLRR